MIHFCTLIDSGYLSRGLAMYESLMRHEPRAFLHIVTMDDKSYEILNKLNLKQTKIIPLADIETPELLAVKAGRKMNEYCWTCKPVAIKTVLDQADVDSCTYLDGDLYFFASPGPLFEEITQASVLLTPHRYTPRYDRSKKSGYYCAQYLSFKNDKEGREVLKWWHNACVTWCFARHEKNRSGDQKYLEDMKRLFPAVHESAHLGAGVGPWNMQQYQFHYQANQLIGTELATKRDFELIFFHFHSLKLLPSGKVDLGSYEVPETVLEYIYKPYIALLRKLNQQLSADWQLTAMEAKKKSFQWKACLKFIKRKLCGEYFVINL